MKTVGVLLVCAGLVIFFPVAMMYLLVRVGRLGGTNSDRIELVGPSVGDLRQAADEKFVRRFMRPAFLVMLACVAAGGTLILLAE